ncbi:DUF6962 family protein [Bacteroidota bacterium]
MIWGIKNPDLVQPDIEIFNIIINEPVTSLTDLIIGAVCIWAFIKLLKLPKKNNIQTYLILYFLGMGLATIHGGIIGHGLLYLFSFEWKLPAWFVSMIAVASLERSAIIYARKIINPKLGVFFSWLNIIELLTFMYISFSTLNFYFVMVHMAYGLIIVVASFHFYVYRKTKSRGSYIFLIAVLLSAISGLIFLNEWGINKWFNHVDISHIFMTGISILLYYGSKEIITKEIKNSN